MPRKTKQTVTLPPAGRRSGAGAEGVIPYLRQEAEGRPTDSFGNAVDAQGQVLVRAALRKRIAGSPKAPAR